MEKTNNTRSLKVESDKHIEIGIMNDPSIRRDRNIMVREASIDITEKIVKILLREDVTKNTQKHNIKSISWKIHKIGELFEVARAMLVGSIITKAFQDRLGSRYSYFIRSL